MKPANDWTDHKWDVADDTMFPSIMTDFAQMSFKQVYETDPEYVKFIRVVTGASGLFKAFQEYIKIRDATK
jgi:hypothetical protein